MTWAVSHKSGCWEEPCSLRHIVVVGSCVVAWAGPATAQVGPSKAAQAFKDANRFYQQQDYSRAAEKYEEAVQLDPSLPGVYFYLANSAEEYLLKAKEARPEDKNVPGIWREEQRRCSVAASGRPE